MVFPCHWLSYRYLLDLTFTRATRYRQLNMATHNHTCTHCDMHWSCPTPCVFSYDVSKWHNCGERADYSNRMRWLMADYKPCQYGCKALPCMHNKLAEKVEPVSYRRKPEYERAQVRQLGGKLVVADEHFNAWTCQQLRAQKAKRGE